ncbi:MAG: hypothetical protein ABUK20_13200 [Anaerolineales bacterium]
MDEQVAFAREEYSLSVEDALVWRLSLPRTARAVKIEDVDLTQVDTSMLSTASL